MSNNLTDTLQMIVLYAIFIGIFILIPARTIIRGIIGIIKHIKEK